MRWSRVALWLGLCWSLLALPCASGWAQGVEVRGLAAQRGDGGAYLDFDLRVTLPRVVEDALQRGLPLYFVTQATLYRPRWYWRDERVAQATRAWRLSYQPLTDRYRVSLGALSQSFSSLDEAMQALTRTAHWRIAEAAQIDDGDGYYVEFGWQLDTTQLPRPMQIGIGGDAAWAIGAERTVKLD